MFKKKEPIKKFWCDWKEKRHDNGCMGALFGFGDWIHSIISNLKNERQVFVNDDIWIERLGHGRVISLTLIFRKRRKSSTCKTTLHGQIDNLPINGILNEKIICTGLKLFRRGGVGL